MKVKKLEIAQLQEFRRNHKRAIPGKAGTVFLGKNARKRLTKARLSKVRAYLVKLLGPKACPKYKTVAKYVEEIHVAKK